MVKSAEFMRDEVAGDFESLAAQVLINRSQSAALGSMLSILDSRLFEARRWMLAIVLLLVSCSVVFFLGLIDTNFSYVLREAQAFYYIPAVMCLLCYLGFAARRSIAEIEVEIARTTTLQTTQSDLIDTAEMVIRTLEDEAGITKSMSSLSGYL